MLNSESVFTFVVIIINKNINCWHLLEGNSVKGTPRDSVRQRQEYILERERERNSPT